LPFTSLCCGCSKSWDCFSSCRAGLLVGGQLLVGHQVLQGGPGTGPSAAAAPEPLPSAPHRVLHVAQRPLQLAHLRSPVGVDVLFQVQGAGELHVVGG
jgi:hypothetical protein